MTLVRFGPCFLRARLVMMSDEYGAAGEKERKNL
jgi:hypothetical protein